MLTKYTYYLTSIFKLLTGFQNWPLVLRVFLGFVPEGPYTVRLRQRGLQFRVRGAMDIWILKETFLDRFYEKYSAPVEAGWQVLDVGAGLGDFSLFAATAHPSSTVYAFEPFPESIALLRENMLLNGVANVRPFQEAVGAETGTLALDLSGGEPLQLQSHQPEAAELPEAHLVTPSVSLAHALARVDGGRCDLLKMDCEGAEYPILFNAPDETLQQVDRIVMEYHDNVTAHTHQDLAAFLREKGFRVQVFPNPVHAYLGFLFASRV